MKFFMKVGYISAMILVVTSFVQAEHTIAKTEAELDKLIKDNHLVVLMCYYKDDSLTKQKMEYAKYSERLLKRMSLKDRYDEAHIMFVEVNIADKALEGLKAKYNIKKYPTFFLFVDGKPVLHNDGKRVYLQEIPEENQLAAFIERYIGVQIDVLVGTKDKFNDISEDEDSQECDYCYPRNYYYRYYDYPYYYHPYGYGAYPWWPYYGRRYYWEPRGGFGFSFGW